MKKSYKAELYRGKVKKTKNQKKKHISQMTEEEIAFLKNEIQTFPYWKLEPSLHLEDRKIGFNMDEIQNTLDYLKRDVLAFEDYVIEYNETKTPNKNTERRLLIKSYKTRLVTFKTYKRKKVRAEGVMSFVISLDTFQIVTVFWNKVDDNHQSRDYTRYDANLSIIKKEEEPIKKKRKRRRRRKKVKTVIEEKAVS